MIPINIRLYDKSIHYVGDIGYKPGREISVTTIADYQRKAEIELLTAAPGELAEPASLGTLVITNLPSGTAGRPRITLWFYLDADNTLNIEVFCDDLAKKQIRISQSDLKQGALFPLALGPESTAIPKVVNLHMPDKPADVRLKTIPSDAETVKINIAPEKSHERKDEKKIGEEHREKDSGIIILIVSAAAILTGVVLFFVFITQSWNKTAAGDASTIPEPTVLIEPTTYPEPSALPEQTTLPAAIEEPTPANNENLSDASSTGTDANRIPAATETPLPAVDIISLNNRIKQIGSFYFNPDSAVLRDSAERKKIRELALIVSEYKDRIVLLIKGHTAMAGTVGEQQGLSLLRARVIRDALVAENAIAASACKTTGAGVSEPATANPDMAHLNRRVEVSAVSSR